MATLGIVNAQTASTLLSTTQTSGLLSESFPGLGKSLDLTPDNSSPASKEVKEVKWYDQIQLRGYGQVRYNNLLMSNASLGCEQCDKTLGATGGFGIRRLRLIFSGHLSPKVYFYFQPDFAQGISSTSLHYVQMRDVYLDLGLDNKNEFRFRVGLSKMPYGFDNMQSSQNRLAFDRSDAINSGLPNERDLGVVFYWAPEKIKKLYASLVKEGLKGTGDYGVFGLGAFNGQTMNKPELNNRPHIAARLAYPLQLKNGQIIEGGIQAFRGQFVIAKDQTSVGTKIVTDRNYLDTRVAATFVLYPKPFGIQAEFTMGKGPEFNKLTDSIECKNLQGGYITASYRLKVKKQLIIPYCRGQYYNGGKKLELDARSYRVKELEAGIEWPMNKFVEFTAAYMVSNRRYEDFVKQDNLQKGHTIRLQAQLNF